MKIKRFALALLAGLLLTSCSGEPVELMNFIDESSGIDYEGYQCYYLARKSDNADKNILDYDRTTLQGDALIKRIDDIKNDINVEVIIDKTYDESTYQTAAMSGLVKADIV